MPLEPQPIGAPSSGEAPGPRTTWYRKVLSLCFVVFCFEVGVFLMVFPWLDYWNSNSLTTYSPWLADVWGSPFFRGALSGLGLVNIYISFLEILRLIRGQMERHSD
jgi:hypothetical protein